ncbi:hypothetical protein C8F04DRAFT_1132042 [Mycena alexandri]|uniref:Uncharacterized protein n=1 Tax=Mycena alexandri TaxID=1745969 RepID=A0AAD6SF52_9AGAR|nr:hypothetical protein C8F04DRAFT_1132042 [Mycena alexandri]
MVLWPTCRPYCLSHNGSHRCLPRADFRHFSHRVFGVCLCFQRCERRPHPKPDGSQEVIAARFVPLDGLSRVWRGRDHPHARSSISSTRSGVSCAAGRPLRNRAHASSCLPGMCLVAGPLAHGAWGCVTLATYEGDQTRGEPEGRLHRAHVRSEKGGITTEIKLECKFDILIYR